MISRFGSAALLIEPVPAAASAPAALEAVMALHTRLVDSAPGGVIALVPAARTVLVKLDPRALSLAAAQSWIEQTLAAPTASSRRAGPVVELDIRYDGPDLADTAQLLGVSDEELIARHSGVEWTVAFTGFAPGFGYLVAEDWPFDVPRLASPRTRVPTGAVGLAAGFAGAYPRATPGGWRLIGTTSAQLFDPDAASPALLAPGARVRFTPTRPASTPAGPASTVAPADELSEPSTFRRTIPQSGPLRRKRDGSVGRDAAPGPAPAVRVEASGLIATVQDLGRPDAAALGVSPSGALDRGALRTANRLVGNRESAAGIEIAMGGFRAMALADTWIAVTGAWGPMTVGGHPLDHGAPRLWRAGEELHLDWFTAGARAYFALRGGVAAPIMLDSRATDTLAGLGPAALAAGDEITLATETAGPVPPVDLAPWSPPGDEIEVQVHVGPRDAWFAASALPTLFESVWVVDAATDRVGMRLQGPALERVGAREVPSEGMVTGAIQVPPSGSPTILLADGPVTGGYPVIATVDAADLDLLGQARPGTRIRFGHARSH
ncbi:urea amidolyase family protein [Microbacterium sediminicola]